LTDGSVNGDKRARLLQAAVRVFARKGFHGARVGDVAAEAGVAHGLVYHYFSSKDELLETIFRDTWTALLAAMREVEDGDDSAREQLRKVGAIVLRTWTRDPDLVRVLVNEVTRGPQLQREIAEIRQAFRAIERIVASGQERGQLRRGLDPRLAAFVFYGALEEILTGWILGELDADVAEAERAVVDIVCGGLDPARVATA
jgi:TetR/AcrR family transcriptional regulator, fatty acid metabolism regulator protein